MNHNKELTKLNHKCKTAMGIFTNTIKTLEEVTDKQEMVKAKIELEIETLASTSTKVTESIASNNRMLEKLKNLIG